MLKEVQLDPSIFRLYDIRGIVGEALTETNVHLIGLAIGSLVRDEGGDTISLGRDGRLSSPVLSISLCNGLLASGCDVIDLGMVPTPLLYYATHVFKNQSGVMLTGSHNPSNYNGMKMVIEGKTLSGERIANLYQRILTKQFHQGVGVKHEHDIVERYVNHVARDVKLARPLKIVIDAGSGVTGMIAPQLFRRLGCEVHELFCEVDGHFPHHHPDPSDEKNLHDLIRLVRDTKADVGLAFDGDGDRLGVVTSAGEIIWPDRLLMLYAKSLLTGHQPAKIIFDVKCTSHLPTLINSLGGEPIMWKTGHSLIKAKLAETRAQLAGEMSGHFFFKDRWYGFDDALYAGARLLEILAHENHNSAAVFAAIPNSVNTPELKVYVKEEEKFSLMRELISQAKFHDADVTTIDGLRVNFADGWGLMRPSNTTPCLILRFEAENDRMLKHIQDLFKDWILSVRPDLVLPF